MLLPVLGEQYGRVLENQEISIEYEAGAFFARYWQSRFPIGPRTILPLLGPIVEEFVDGREFAVSLLGPTEDPTVLPLREVDYRLPPHLPRLLTYEAKWVTGSPEYGGTLTIAASDLDPELERQLHATAEAAYRAVGLRDYGRIDLRVHPTDGPVVVDVNPNPELLPGELGIAGAALEAGLSFKELIRVIVEQAVARGTTPNG